MPKITLCCCVCGSEEVSRDAVAYWDVDTQQWSLGAVYDDTYCCTCDRQQKLEERPVQEEQS